MMKFYPTLLSFMLFLCIGNISMTAQNAQEFNLENNRLRQPLYFNGEEGLVKFCNLIKGEDYKIWANGNKKGCSATIKHKSSEETAGTSVMTFTATEECMEFLFQKDLTDKGCDGEQYVSIGCQTCNSEKNDFQKQMALGVAGGFDDETLIKNVFIGGGCFDVENVEGKGAQEGKGIFSGGHSSISIGDGVILSSGSIYDAMGPNNGEGTGQNVGGDTADPDLSL